MVAPNPPTIRFIAQVAGSVQVGVAQASTTGTYPIASFRLSRTTQPTLPGRVLGLFALSDFVLTTPCTDTAPVIGFEQWYSATALDSQGTESTPCAPMPFTAFNPSTVANPISAAALGPYPFLGSDVFLNPTTGEAVIGPNGDLLTVNGLELLAQDLRIRILTTLGDLPMHQTFGFATVIGSGQAGAQAQAQILQANVIDALSQEPRVNSIVSVLVTQLDAFSWAVAYTVEAKTLPGLDPLYLNAVLGYNWNPVAA